MKKINAIVFNTEEFNALNTDVSIYIESGEWFWTTAYDISNEEILKMFSEKLNVNIINIYVDINEDKVIAEY